VIVCPTRASKLASAYVEVNPDLAGFGEKAKAGVDSQTRNLKATAKVDLDIASAEAKAAQLRARLDRLNAIIARPEVTPQMADAYTKLDGLQAELERLNGMTATPKVKADIADTQAKIDALKAKLDSLEAKDTEVRVKAAADVLVTQAELDQLSLKMDELNAKSVSLKIGTGNVSQDLAGAIGKGAQQGASRLPGILGKAASNPAVAAGIVAAVGVALPYIGQIIGGAVVAGFGTGLAAIAIKGASEFKPVKDAFASLKIQANAELRQIGVPFRPVMLDILHTAGSVLGQMEGSFKDAAKIISGPFEQFATTLEKSFGSPAVKESIKSVATSFGDMLKAITPTLSGDISGIANSVSGIAKAVAADPQSFANFVTFLAGVAKFSLDSVAGLTRAAEGIDHIARSVATLNSVAPKGDNSNPLRFFSDQSIIAGVKKLNDFLPNLLQKEADGLTRVNSAGGKASGTTRALADHTNSLLHPLKTASDGLGVLARNAGASVQPIGNANSHLQNYAETAQQAAQQTTDLNNAWNNLVGNFASEQQALISASKAIGQYGKDVKQSGGNSDVAKYQFYATAQSIDAVFQAMTNSHAPASQMYTDLTKRIEALKTEGIYNKAERQEYDNLVIASNKVAYSTQGMTKSQLSAASALENRMIPDLKTMHADSTTARGDIDALANSIVNTGRKSDATKAARAKLIADLEKSGVNAKTATGFVDSYIKKLGKIPAKDATQILLSGKGQWSVTESNIYPTPSGQAPNPILHPKPPGGAAGMLVRGGIPGKDSVLINAMPGEVVVPEKMVKAGAVDHLRGQIPGFSTGGYVGQGASGLGDFAQQRYHAEWSSMVSTMEKDMAAAVNAAIAAAKAAAAGAGGPVGGDAGKNKQLGQKMVSAAGWGSQFGAFNNIAMAESGWNRFARNPSGAYGIPQALPASKMGAAANPPTSSASAQIGWMINYIRGRYGNPDNAWSFHVAHGWYDKGGWLKPGGIPVNGLSRPEAVLTPDESAAFIQLVKGLVASGGTGRGGVSVHGNRHGGPVSVNYFGTTRPTPEQEQAMLLKLGSLIGVA
jgi:hypothetical protein